jgi:hypothetical protein
MPTTGRYRSTKKPFLMMLDAGSAQTLEQQFMDDLGFANEIRLDDFSRRGAIDRIKESACYAFWRVL